MILSLVSVHANFILLVSWAKSLANISESSLCLHTQPINKPVGSALQGIFRLLPSDTRAWPASGTWVVEAASLLSSALVFPQTLLPRQPE